MNKNKLSYLISRTILFLVLTVVVAVGYLTTGQFVLAANVQLSGQVNDQFNISIPGVTVTVSAVDVGGSSPDPVTTDNYGDYSFVIGQGTYNIEFTPPNSNNFRSTEIFHKVIDSDFVSNITLYPIAPTVTFSGHILDGLGNPVSGQSLVLLGCCGSTTDDVGYFSMQIPFGGGSGYPVYMNNNAPPGSALPENYNNMHGDQFRGDTSQNFITDIKLPASYIEVHVQDLNGDPIANANVRGICTQSRLAISGVLENLSGGQCNNLYPLITDNSGNVKMWFLTPAYFFTHLGFPCNGAIPPYSNDPSAYTISASAQGVNASLNICNDSLPQAFTIVLPINPNQPPDINILSGGTINAGDIYRENGSFTDSDSTLWTATVDYGDGSGAQPLAFSGTNFSLEHLYSTAGTFIVTVSIMDNQGATGTRTATITVNVPPIKVHILKYLNGVKADATSANDYQFPMTATWKTATLNGGVSASGNYALGYGHGGAPDLYGADTSPMSVPADYTTSEMTGSSSLVVSSLDQCVPGKYLLNGYRTSVTSFADAATQILTAAVPVFVGLTSDRYIIVDNSKCPVAGTISGMKYNDINRNGKKDANEPGLSGWVIRLILDNDKSNHEDDKGTLLATATTDVNGSYTFSNVAPGTYEVRETHQNGWKRMSKNPKDIVIVAGSNVADVNFGNAVKKKTEKDDTNKDDDCDDQSGDYYANHGKSNYENDQNKKAHKEQDDKRSNEYSR